MNVKDNMFCLRKRHHVCIYVCIYVCMYICIYVYMYVASTTFRTLRVSVFPDGTIDVA